MPSNNRQRLTMIDPYLMQLIDAMQHKFKAVARAVVVKEGTEWVRLQRTRETNDQ